MEKNIITLFKNAGMWKARFSGPHAEKVRFLFGADTLPTAFTDATAPEFVLAQLRELNPGVDVKLAVQLPA